MRQIRSKHTKPELLVRKFLFANGFHFRLHSKKLKGKPDIVIHKKKVVIFVHGCFWHGHKNCINAKMPLDNRNFWKKKIVGNALRDNRNLKLLRKEGWEVIIIWECQLHKKKSDKTLKKLLKKLK